MLEVATSGLDAVLEYRVWLHPDRGVSEEADGSDYYYAFASCEDAQAFARATAGAEEPLAFVLQREFIAEPEDSVYVHVCEGRVTEWPVAFLCRPKRTDQTNPDFLSLDAPSNRLAILRGTSD